MSTGSFRPSHDVDVIVRVSVADLGDDSSCGSDDGGVWEPGDVVEAAGGGTFPKDSTSDDERPVVR